MSEREPITGELRKAVEWCPTFCGPDKAMVPQPEFDRLCDAIDAMHAGLERENAELRERLAALDNRSDSMHIGSATITVTPRLDWTGVARELRSIADTLSSCNCSNDCTNNERTEACHRALAVEDVLAEFSVRVLNSGHQWGLESTEVIAEYAAKLRLAEVEDT